MEILAVLLLTMAFVALVAVYAGCASLLKFLLGKDEAWVMGRMGWRKSRKRKSRKG